MNNFYKKSGVIAILILIAGFLFFYFTLSFFNRFAADDFYLLSMFRDEGGVAGALAKVYSDWVPRWASLLHVNIWFYLLGEKMLFPFQIATLIMLLGSSYLFFRSLFRNYFKINLSASLIFILSAFFVISCFYSTINTGELWFWVSSTIDYVWPLSFLLLSFGLILQNNSRWYSFLLLLISAAYIGGSVEPLSITLLFFIPVYFIYSIVKRRSLLIKSNESTKLFFFFLTVLASFLIVLFSPGKDNRMATLPDPSVLSGFKGVWITFIHYGKIFFFERNQTVVLIGLFWLSLSLLFPEFRLNYSILKKLRMPLLVVVLSVFIYCFLISLILSDIGPDRAYSFAVFAFNFVWMIFIFSISEMIARNPVSIYYKWIATFVMWTFVVLFFFHFKSEIPIAKKYALSVNDRIAIIQKNKMSEKNLMLQKLNESGMLYSAEITNDSSHFKNIFLSKYFQIRKKPIAK